jgi:glycosyltransferase involved in cell wall biosynthesis
MACGLPVIGADSPGIRELICHGETGWLCGTDSASIRTAIQLLLADAALRQRLGRNARRFVEENFTLDRIVEMELALLREVVE